MKKTLVVLNSYRFYDRAVSSTIHERSPHGSQRIRPFQDRHRAVAYSGERDRRFRLIVTGRHAY